MKGLKESRLASFIVILLVYIIATAVGVLIYNALNYSWWLSLLIADVGATVVTFIFSVIFNNASVYDPYWSVQPPVILIAFCLGKSLNLLSALLLIAVGYWALRLTANWAYTFANLNHQDWRYTMLREKTGVFYPLINFLGIHLVPTLVVYGCILPAVYAVVHQISPNFLSVIFIVLAIGSATMQGIADVQMHRYRKNRTSAFIRSGLWKHSRHPNYLGEILMWWSVALSVVCANINAWFLISGAIANTLLFVFISIPLADGRQSRKQGFKEYKNQTRALLPFKK